MVADDSRNDADDRGTEDLLRRADFSRETDFKERLWNRLAGYMVQESLVMDLTDDDLAQAAGGWRTNGTTEPPTKTTGF